MQTCFTRETDSSAVPIHPLTSEAYSEWLSTQEVLSQKWLHATGFAIRSGHFCFIPDEQGHIQCVLLGVKDYDDFWSFGALSQNLPEGRYHIAPSFFPSLEHYFRACLAWGLGAYQFTQYQEAQPKAQLVLAKDINTDYLMNWVESIYLGRDWINTPADSMNPPALVDHIKTIGKNCSATVSVIEGKALLKADYPAIYAVGKGAEHEPRLVELCWGAPGASLVTVIGKGVCFDSGGLDIKSANGMRFMKKDMSGAAHAAMLAHMIMKEHLPIRLRVLIPVVENAVDAHSYHPGDVITTRAGISVEIENTDAEGRLILCDALAAAVEQTPDLIIDFASLTGAAYVALGPDLPAFYSNQDSLAEAVLASSRQHQDPLWRMPLYKEYEKYLKSDIADCINCSTNAFGGSITAALYLQKFVPDSIPWMHFDLSAWNYEARPGRAKGAEILALRAVWGYLKERFS